MGDNTDIRQDQSRPSPPEDELPTKRLKNSRKKGAGHGIILKKWILKSKQGIKENHLKDDGEINKNQQTIQTVMRVHKHKDNRQKELRKFLTDWIIDDLQPLYVV
ncbi:unnamed protein product [Rhizophagus irregularis]|nr:unnamed protein product [Rhizophagus irregularis]